MDGGTPGVRQEARIHDLTSPRMALPALENLLFEFNRLRHGALNDDPWNGQLDRLAQAAFRAAEHLVAYGSLAPGRPNHARVAELAGSWESGWVEGDLEATGWGASRGFPALRWRPGGPRIPAYLLRSKALRGHWAELDRFEGTEYRRILVPFHTDAGLRAVGYLYAATHSALA